MNLDKVGDETHSLSQPGQQHESTNAGTNVKAHEQKRVGAIDGSVATGVGKSTANFTVSDDGQENVDTIMDSASLLKKNHQTRQPGMAMAANQSDATGTMSYLQGNLAQDSSAFTHSRQHQAFGSIEQEDTIKVGFENVADP